MKMATAVWILSMYRNVSVANGLTFDFDVHETNIINIIKTDMRQKMYSTG